jgi:hypothetical protein
VTAPPLNRSSHIPSDPINSIIATRCRHRPNPHPRFTKPENIANPNPLNHL